MTTRFSKGQTVEFYYAGVWHPGTVKAVHIPRDRVTNYSVQANYGLYRVFPKNIRPLRRGLSG